MIASVKKQLLLNVSLKTNIIKCYALIAAFLASSIAFAQADFNSDIQKGCAPITINFKDKSKNAVSWLWDFGNGNTSKLQNPSAIYINPGKYDISLTITDNTGKKTTKQITGYITVFKLPKAEFTVNPNPVCLGNATAFKDNTVVGDGAINSWLWDAGDGKLYNTAGPSHTYKNDGVFNVSLIVVDINGCKSQITKTKYVTVLKSPTAAFAIDTPKNCKYPHKFKTSNQSTGLNLSYAWQWDIGNSSTSKDINGVYNSFGNRNVTLTVTDINGCKSVATEVVSTQPLNAEIIGDSIICGNRAANFSYSPQLPGTAVVDWDFGNGTKSNFAKSSTTYLQNGTYTVTLNLRYLGCTITKTKIIKVLPKPIVKIKLLDSKTCTLPRYYTFTAESPDNLISTKWKFQKSDTSWKKVFGTKINTVITNIFEVTPQVIIESSDGCIDTFKSQQSFISKLMSVKITGAKDGCIPLNLVLNYSANLLAPIKTITWELDGVKSYGTNLSVILNKKGCANVKLTIVDTNKCVTGDLVQICAGKKIKPNLEIPKGPICNGTIITAKNKTPQDNDIDKFEWQWQDIDTKKSINGATGFPYADNKFKIYETTRDDSSDVLLITHSGPCKDTIIKSIAIKKVKRDITFIYNRCGTDSIVIINKTAPNVQQKLFINEVKSPIKLITKLPRGDYFIKHIVYDSSVNCIDTLLKKINLNIEKPEITVHNKQLCVPAVVMFVGKSNYKNYFIVINKKDTFWQKDTFIKTFTDPGRISYEYWYEVENNCWRAEKVYTTVYGETLNGRVELIGSCLPSKIKLWDYSYRSDKKHIWKLGNGQLFKVNAQLMEETVLNNVLLDSMSVTLDVETDTGNCITPITWYIKPKGPKITNIYWANNPSCDKNFVDVIINHDPRIGKKPFTYELDMGDGNIFNVQAKNKYAYPDEKRYLIKVAVTDANGCKATDTGSFFYTKTPSDIVIKADTTTKNCPPLVAKFSASTANSKAAILEYNWDFGDGAVSKLPNPEHIYTGGGAFSVTLTVKDANGCIKKKTFKDFILIKGPTGNYSFDKDRGCEPLLVTFKDSTERADTIEWDFGDGVVHRGTKPIHNYQKPGRFIPLLILKDKYGCKFSLAPIDTIYVFAIPKADFTSKGICANEKVEMKSQSVSYDVPIKTYSWKTNDNTFYFAKDTSHVFQNDYKNASITHQIITEEGCENTLTKPHKLYGIDAQIISNKDTICVGSPFIANMQIASDTTIKYKAWYVDDVFETSNNTLNLPMKQIGIYNIDLKVKDVLGCEYTALNKKSILVGDTIPPIVNPILHISTDNDITHEIKYNKFPNFDFKSYNIYRWENGQYKLIVENYNRLDTLIKLYNVDALHHSYCYRLSTKNLCGIETHTPLLKEHCTVEVRGEADTNAAILRWNNYTGWPVNSYDIYREAYGNMIYLNTVPGNKLEYIDSTISCYKNHVYRIFANEKNGNLEHSWSDTCHVKPIWINSVPPPTPRRVTVVDDKYIQYEFDSSIKCRIPIDYYLIEKRTLQSSFNTVAKVIAHDSLLLRDKNVKVDDLNYIYRVKAVDECGDKSIFTTISKSILLNVGLNNNYIPSMNFTKYMQWPEGVSIYEIEKQTANGSFVKIATLLPSDTLFTDNLTSLNCIPKIAYRIKAISNGPDVKVSYSNVSEPPVAYKCFIPNAFTPNENNLNENFKPIGIYIVKYTMKIYTRWGEKVYESSECENAWNGMYNGKQAQQGVYVYLIETLGADGYVRRYKGDVTLLR